MEQFAHILHQEMEADLHQVSMDNRDILHRAQRSFYVVQGILLRLKEFISNHRFAGKTEEIVFFKSVKPRFHKELLYWEEIIYIETHKPTGSRKMLKEYYIHSMERIDLYFKRNLLLYGYYKMGHTEDDEELFTRTSEGDLLIPGYSLDMDTRFCTVNSTRLAKIMAFEEVYHYLNGTLENLSDRQKATEQSEQRRSLTWTGSKAQFIELGYALQSAGVINNGKADIKEVMEWMQFCLNIKVTNFYGYFQSMRIRKKERTPFLKMLIDYVTRRMDESDEFPRYS